jgi:hypothetical protein
MAKQKGIVKLEGTIGDITFLKTRDGYLAKEKSSIPAERIANDPAFQRTRENGAEFGRAGKSGKFFRNAFRTVLQTSKDRRMTSRLTREMMRVLQADTVNARGMRNVIEGDLLLLTGFDFNINSKLSTTIYAPYTTSINRVNGELSVQIPSFTPAHSIAAPAGTTHFKIRTAAAAIDFESGLYNADMKETTELPWDQNATALINLVNNVGANSTHPLFLLLGIEFSQEVNGVQYPLKNGAFNAMAIVEANV